MDFSKLGWSGGVHGQVKARAKRRLCTKPDTTEAK
jgi:hypothetical protein